MTGRRRISDTVFSADGKRILYKWNPESNIIRDGEGKEIPFERRANKSVTYGGSGSIISEE
jgi:hypothetical protein